MATDIETLKVSLSEWTDWDGAQYCAAVALGLIDPALAPFQTRAKHVFWTDNPVGNALLQILETLVTLGVLNKRDEPDLQFRWNPEFRGTWERSVGSETDDV